MGRSVGRDRRASPAAAAITVALSLAAIGALLWLGRAGWGRFVPNAQIAERRWFCEALRDGVVRQPANSWSNLGFVAVAAAIAASSRRLAGGALVTRLYVALVALLGVGSMCLHATETRWGGIADVTSMIVYIAFVAAYALARLLRVERRGLLALYGAITVGAEGLYLLRPRLGLTIFGALIVVFVAAEFAARRRAPAPDGRWLAAAAIFFGVGFAVWIPSQNGRALCVPDSLWQGHAFWHVCCAVAAGCLFAYFAPRPLTA